MALFKTTVTKQGFEASYWKIDACTIDKRDNEASCVVDLYKDATTSNAKEACIDSRYVTLYQNNPNEEERTALFNKFFGEVEQYIDVYNAFYEMVKELDVFFADAENC